MVVRSLRQAAPAPSHPVTFMNSSSNDNGPGPERTPAGLVVGRDLMFTAKVTGTAGDLGYRMRVAGDLATARRLIEELQPRLILVDLAAGDLAAPESLARLPAARRPVGVARRGRAARRCRAAGRGPSGRLPARAAAKQVLGRPARALTPMLRQFATEPHGFVQGRGPNPDCWLKGTHLDTHG